MIEKIKAYAATEAKGEFLPFEFETGELGSEEVEIKVEYCGICHSDVSMWENEWMQTVYPFVGGHEIVGKVVAVGENVKSIEIGETVGLGWNAGSDMSCPNCLRGDHQMCQNLVQTIVNRYGGFADKVRCHWAWAVKLPDEIDATKAGPLFCGGITVFNPFVQFHVKPTDKVGIIGIGGLGHLALQFADKWGCEVTAFTSDLSKTEELKKLGADYVVNSRSDEELEKLKGKFDLILSTVNVPLNWSKYLEALNVRGRLHLVGAVLEPVPVGTFELLGGQKSVSASPSGSPATVAQMLEFCARHNIETVTENFKMSQINEAFEHLESGKARYRIVLENDF